jgi:hypothetical protein
MFGGMVGHDQDLVVGADGAFDECVLWSSSPDPPVSEASVGASGVVGILFTDSVSVPTGGFSQMITSSTGGSEPTNPPTFANGTMGPPDGRGTVLLACRRTNVDKWVSSCSSLANFSAKACVSSTLSPSLRRSCTWSRGSANVGVSVSLALYKFEEALWVSVGVTDILEGALLYPTLEVGDYREMYGYGQIIEEDRAHRR